MFDSGGHLKNFKFNYYKAALLILLDTYFIFVSSMSALTPIGKINRVQFYKINVCL